MKAAGGNRRIAAMKDGEGHFVQEAEEIAEVFAKFYEELYQARMPEEEEQAEYTTS